MEKPPPKPREIPWWQLPAEAIVRNPVIRKLYGLDKQPKTTTFGQMKPKEK